MILKPQVLMIGAAVGVGVLALLYLRRQTAQGTGEAIGGALADMASGIFSGTVLGVGDAVGVPRTDLTECERAKLEGRTWDASFVCEAVDYLKYLVTPAPISPANPNAPQLPSVPIWEGVHD